MVRDGERHDHIRDGAGGSPAPGEGKRQSPTGVGFVGRAAVLCGMRQFGGRKWDIGSERDNAGAVDHRRIVVAVQDRHT